MKTTILRIAVQCGMTAVMASLVCPVFAGSYDMAYKSLEELSWLDLLTVDPNDVIVVHDVSDGANGKTKRITTSDLIVGVTPALDRIEDGNSSVVVSDSGSGQVNVTVDGSSIVRWSAFAFDLLNGRLSISDNAIRPPLNVTERSSEPSSPISGDIYLDDGSNTLSGSPGWRRYTGSDWEEIAPVIADHGALSGLGDDDHTQYTLADGTRTFTGDQSFGGHNINDVDKLQFSPSKVYFDFVNDARLDLYIDGALFQTWSVVPTCLLLETDECLLLETGDELLLEL